MGSVPKARYCERAEQCVRYEPQTGKPEKLSRYNKQNVCHKCAEKFAGAIPVSRETEWMHEVGNAIKRAAVDGPGLETSSKSSPWDLLELNRYNGGWGYQSDFGKALAQMDAMALCKVKDWLDDNSGEIADRYGDASWGWFRFAVGFGAYVKQLPPRVRRENFDAGLPDDGLPIQGVAMRVDGKKWDLNIPVRAKLLLLAPRYFAGKDYAKALGIGRGRWRGIRDRMEHEGFTLGGFTLDVLGRIMRGKKRGPEEKK